MKQEPVTLPVASPCMLRAWTGGKLKRTTAMKWTIQKDTIFHTQALSLHWIITSRPKAKTRKKYFYITDYCWLAAFFIEACPFMRVSIFLGNAQNVLRVFCVEGCGTHTFCLPFKASIYIPQGRTHELPLDWALVWTLFLKCTLASELQP